MLPNSSHTSSGKDTAPYAIAVVIGVVLWLVATALSGKTESWDATAYWVLAYPAAIAVSAVLGYFYPERPWRWAVALFEAHLLGMFLRGGEAGGLWPLGMVMLAVMALPGVAAANYAARFGRGAGSVSREGP